MESSSRMRPFLRRNYTGTDHFGAAADFEEQNDVKKIQEDVISSSNTPILAAEAISTVFVNEDDEHPETDNVDSRGYVNNQSEEGQQRLSGITEQTLEKSIEPKDTKLASEQNLVQSSTIVAPGYVPSELDERILFELPSSMVRPLRVIRGTFQVSC